MYSSETRISLHRPIPAPSHSLLFSVLFLSFFISQITNKQCLRFYANNPPNSKTMANSSLSTPFAPPHPRYRNRFPQHSHNNTNSPHFKHLNLTPSFLLTVSPSSHFRLFAFPPRRPNFALQALDSDAPNQVPLPLAIRFVASFSHCLTLSTVRRDQLAVGEVKATSNGIRSPPNSPPPPIFRFCCCKCRKSHSMLGTFYPETKPLSPLSPGW